MENMRCYNYTAVKCNLEAFLFLSVPWGSICYIDTVVTIGTAFISDCFSNEIQFSLSFWWIQLQQLSDQAHNEHRIPTNVAELQREANITWDWTLLQRDSGVIKFCHMVQLIEIKKPGQCGASANYRDTEWVTMRVHAAEVMQRRDTNGMIKLLNSSHLKRQQVSKALPLAEVSPRPIRLSRYGPQNSVGVICSFLWESGYGRRTQCSPICSEASSYFYSHSTLLGETSAQL